jgi:hypothetical protein
VLQKLRLRNQVALETRKYLDSKEFLDVETPVLIKSTPEGARDFVVPSRMNEGQFYALPQSPQTFKQLLMVSGFDRYYQIVKCFRDEDLRADRQPEFTQIDCEMAFVEQNDILEMFEGLIKHLFKTVRGVEFEGAFPRMTYAEAMEKYGSDKPDLRYGLEIVDVTEWAGNSGFKVFQEAVAGGQVVRAINAKQAAGRFSNTELKPGGKLSEVVTRAGGKGLAWLKVEEGKYSGGIEKFFNAGAVDALGTPPNSSTQKHWGAAASAALCRTLPHSAALCRHPPLLLHSAAFCRTLPPSAALCRTLPHSAALCRHPPLLLHSAAFCRTSVSTAYKQTGVDTLRYVACVLSASPVPGSRLSGSDCAPAMGSPESAIRLTAGSVPGYCSSGCRPLYSSHRRPL